MEPNLCKAPPFPRLAIGDLLLLTLCIGLALALVAPDYHNVLNVPTTTWSIVARDLARALASGTALFGLAALVRLRLRHSRDIDAPGHWLLLATGPSFVATFVRRVIQFIVAFASNQGWVSNVCNSILAVLVIGLSIALSLRGLRTLEWSWRLCLFFCQMWFALVACWSVQNVAYELGMVRSIPFSGALIATWITVSALAAIIALFSIVLDACRRNRRDWLYFVGVVSLLLGVIGPLISWGGFTVQWWAARFLLT